jgi:hypothetical protein
MTEKTLSLQNNYSKIMIEGYILPKIITQRIGITVYIFKQRKEYFQLMPLSPASYNYPIFVRCRNRIDIQC